MSEWRNARKKPLIISFREVSSKKKTLVVDKDFPKGRRIGVEEIETLEGTLYAVEGLDFIIRGVKGELYPIKKSIFFETYDVLETPLEAYVKMKEEAKDDSVL